jgi:hypothetical protein
MNSTVRPYRFVTLAVVAACAAGLLCDRVLRSPDVVHAQDQSAPWLYVEPGVTDIVTPDGNRRFLGKIAIDLRNGKVWALPTLQPAPYPRDHTTTTPPNVDPVFLGRYNLSSIEMQR